MAVAESTAVIEPACGAGGISSAVGVHLQIKNNKLFEGHLPISPAHRYSCVPFAGTFVASAEVG